MKIDPEKRLGLYNRDFDEMRNLLDMNIQQIFIEMIGRKVNSAKVTLAIDFTLNRNIVKDNNSLTGEREAINPEVDYKISFNLQQKGSVDGEIVPKGSDELLVGDDGACYLVSQEEASGQLSMFDTWDEYAAEAMKQVINAMV